MLLNARTLLFALMMVVIAGCTREDVGVQRNDAGGVDVAVTVSEADLNAALTEALNRAPNPLLRDPQIDLQAGQIVISGQHDRRDGGGQVSGSVVLALTLIDGALQAEATAVNIEGFAADDARLAEFNAQFLDNFNRLARATDRVTVTGLTITDDGVNLTFSTRR